MNSYIINMYCETEGNYTLIGQAEKKQRLRGNKG